MKNLDVRKAIADELDEQDATWRNVNEIPEVIEARAKQDKARRAADEAAKAFSRIFDSHTKKGAAMRIAKRHPGIIVLGDNEPEFRWIARCAVTGLPIFAGDRVFIGGGEEDYRRSYILADAVTVFDGYRADPVIVGADGLPESVAALGG